MVVKFTTIAMKLEDKWVVDTYSRMGDKLLSDVKFKERFLTEYAGNGITEFTILETTTRDYYTDTIREYQSALENISETLNQMDGNGTILNY